MTHDDVGTYPLEAEAILNKAPNASGVYTISTPQRWVFVGDSNNVRQRLFELLNAPPPAFDRFGPLSFSSEVVPAAARGARREALRAQLGPACAAA